MTTLAPPDLPTGEVEVVATSIEVLNTSAPLPFQVDERVTVGEEARLKHRYLDLRRPGTRSAGHAIRLRSQVNAAARAIEDLGIVDVAVVGLAKRLEEVWVPGQNFPVVLPRTSEGLYLLQRLRDEAHRFAITFHRQRRSKAMTNSALDGIPGLGEVKRKALLRHFGSVKRIRAASLDELTEVPGIGGALARTIERELTGAPVEPTVNLMTGEIVDDAQKDGND